MRVAWKVLALLLLAPLAFAEYHPPIEYGVGVTIDFVLYNTDGTLDVDESDGGDEVTIFCDEDAGTTATNDFVDEGSFYSITLTSGETQCANITLEVAATDTNVITIPTFGNASAQVNASVDVGTIEGTDATDTIDARLTAYDAVVPADLPANFADLSITATTGRVDVASIEGSDATDQINAAADAALADYDAPTNAELTSGLAGLNDLSAAAVNAEVDTALADYDPPTKAELDTAVADVSVDSIQASALADLFNTDSGTTYASAVSGSVVSEIADNAGGSALSEAGIADAVWDEARSGHTTTGSFGEYVLADVQLWDGSAVTTALETSADIADAVLDEALSGHTTAGTLGKAVSDTLTDTAEIGTAGAGLTAVPWNAVWDAEVQSEATDALNVYDPPTKAELDTAVADVSVDEIQATALADLFNTDSTTTYASAVSGSVVSEIADNAGGSSLSESGIADAVWEEILADHSGTSGSTAESLAAISGGGDGSGFTAIPWNSDWDAEVQSEASDALNAYDPPTAAELTSGLAGLNDLDAAGVRTAVGLASANLDTQIGTLATASSISGLNDLSAAQVNAEVDSALADYDAPTKTELDSGLAGLNDLSAAAVNAEVDTALADYDAPTKAELDSGLAGLNDPTAAAIAAAVMQSTCEDQGSGYTVQECLSILLAEAAGTATYSTGSRTWTVKDPSGSETRLTIVYGSSLDGTRTSSTPAPVTP